MTKDSRSTKKARSEVERLAKAEQDLAAKAARLAAELAEAEGDAGGQILDEALGEKPAGGALARVAGLRAEADATCRAVAAARERRVEAIAELNRCRAGDLERAAGRARSQAKSHRTKTDRLLAELADHEGCEFEPAKLFSDVGGSSGVPRATRSDELEAEATQLEQEARQLRARRPRDAGRVEATDAAGLVAALGNLDPEVIGPPLDELLAWARQAEAEVRAQIDRAPAGSPEADAVPLLAASWSSGRLSRGDCEARVQPLRHEVVFEPDVETTGRLVTSETAAEVLATTDLVERLCAAGAADERLSGLLSRVSRQIGPRLGKIVDDLVAHSDFAGQLRESGMSEAQLRSSVRKRAPQALAEVGDRARRLQVVVRWTGADPTDTNRSSVEASLHRSSAPEPASA